MRPIAVLVAIATLPPLSLQAQLLRGVVTERVSGQPLTGVLVSAANVPDSLRQGGMRHALTNARGEFAITLSAPGTWTISAKRIGVARYSSEAFEIGSGEQKRFAISLDPFESRLPAVQVAATNLCIPKPEQLRTIVSLWDEARTALLASEVTREEHLLVGWLSQYTRTLEPRSLRILQDQRSVAEGLFDRPMRSISGDSLAKVGYWRRQDRDTLVFHAPDAEALLSDPFQSGHCFELVTGSGNRRGLLGLAFRPRRARNMGGIDGTIWLDGGNFELRFIEFRYTNLMTIPPNNHLGGEVHFLRHESGAWIVRRWLVRMPQFPQVTPAAVARGGMVSAVPQAYVYRVIEEGGALFTPGLSSWEKPGAIEGTVMDSTGRNPLLGATVSLSGTPYSMDVDSSGRFRFDSMPPGAYTLLASQRDYADLGQLADDEPLNVVAGETYRSRMKAVTTSELRAVLCDGKNVKPTDASLRMVVTHTDSDEPLSRLRLWLRWPDLDQRGPIHTNPQVADQRLLGVESVTDVGGAVIFCGVPAGIRLEIVVLPDEDDRLQGGRDRSIPVTDFVLKAGEVTSRSISVRPPD